MQKQNELHGVLCVIKSFIRGLFSKYLFRRNFKYNYSVINKNVSHLLFKEIRCSLRVPLVISFFLRHFDLNRLEVIYVKNYARLRSVFLLNNNYYVPAVDCHDFPTSMPVVCPSINRADSFLEYMYNMNIDAYKWPDLSSDNRSMFVVDLQRRIVVLPLAKDISNIVKAYLDIN